MEAFLQEQMKPLEVAAAGKSSWSPAITDLLDLQDGFEYLSLLSKEAFPLPGQIEFCQEKVSE